MSTVLAPTCRRLNPPVILDSLITTIWGRYLASASLRYDGFSNFAPENRYALFPSVSLGWNIHREKFWTIDAISTFKLRGSWGVAGLNDLTLTDTYGGYNAYAYAQGSGILRNNLSNPNLKWERTETTDLALEMGFLRDRFTFSLDFYNKLTKDKLASKPLPAKHLFPSITYNNGTLQNKGVEIEIGAGIINSKSFQWKANFAFAYNKQMVLELPSNGRAKNRQGGDIIYDPVSKQNVDAGGIAEGERPFGLYAYNVLGVFATEAEAAAWMPRLKTTWASPAGITTGKHAGDFIFQDVNSDGIIDAKDQVFMGYRTHDKIGGMQNYFTYKGITLK
jgi:outer membrane receptor protein involved in Fe transport